MMAESATLQPKVLLLEDDGSEAKLWLRELRGASFEVKSEMASTDSEFKEKLRTQRYDLIIADYQLAEHSGLDALRWLRDSGWTTPFILIAGRLGDDFAVECIKMGATDYVLKDKIERLPEACRRALSEERARVESREAEKALRESESQYRLLFESNPLPLWVFDCETLAFLAVNEAAVRHYGYTRQEFLAMTLKEIGPPEGVAALLEGASRDVEGLSETVVWQHRKKDGTIIDVEITRHSIQFGGRRAELVLAHDVTNERRSWEQWRQSEVRFEKAFRSSPLALSITTFPEGRYLTVNEAFVQMLGYPREEVAMQTATELEVWVDPAQRLEMIRQLEESGRLKAFQAKFRTSTGGAKLAEVSGELIEWDGKRCLLANTLDITEAKGLEEQFLQAQKMEAVGRLAGGIAHDFNNMLGVIVGHTELLQERLTSGRDIRNVAEIRKAAEHAASLTRQLLAFSRQQVLAPRVVDLNVIIGNLTEMLRRMIGEDVQLIFRPAESLGSVKADPVQMEQIMMNLAVNARDAMPDGGKLLIETANAELDETFTSNHPSVRPGSYVLLSVSDTGTGMDQATMDHIFEPFFTTKGPGKGTGLGLSMAFGVINQSGGSIWVHSAPMSGTTFKIYLPRVDELPTLDIATEPKPRREAGTETILIVEDEDAIRELVVAFLEDSGYTVLQASDAKKGIQMARASAHIDLLLTDVIMPGLSGSELALALRAVFPNLKLLFMSGYTRDLVAQHGVLTGDEMLLEKPFTKEALLAKVRSVLDRN